MTNNSTAPDTRPLSWLALSALLVSNAIPVLGVLYWGWDLFTLMLLYLGELFVMSAFTYAKLVTVTKAWWNDEIQNSMGIFVGGGLVYFVFICVFFAGVLTIDGEYDTLDPVSLALLGERIAGATAVIWWPLLVTALSHGVSYLFNFLGRGEYLRVTPETLVKAPAWRMIGLHLAIVGGCFLAFDGRDPTLLGILVLMGVKSLADLITHIEEHRQA